MSTDLFHSIISNAGSVVLVVLFLGASIFVHELGHFWVARRRGAHVERFSIGFGPALWSHRGQDGVEYRLSWFPLGGYVLLPQLADLGPIEGEIATDVKKLPPIGYVSKLLILVAGATCNLLFAFALAGLVWFVGEPVLSMLATTKIGIVNPTIKLADGSTVPNPAAEGGLQAGDNVKSIDGHAVSNFEDILNGVILGQDRAADNRRKSVFVIERAGKTLEVVLYPRLLGDDKIRIAGVEPAEDLTADSLTPDWPADQAGVKPGDRILAVDGRPVFQRDTISEHLAQNPARPSTFLIQRDAAQITLQIQPRLDTDERTGKPIPRIGLRYRDNIMVLHPTPWAQISDDVVSIYRTLAALLSPTSDIGPSKLSGPIGIVHALHQQAQWDIRRALWLVILVNVNLAFLNLLPLPVLDGGQILFATIARVRGRALPLNFVMAAQSVFMVLILLMFFYMAGNDLLRIVRDFQADRPIPVAPAK